MTVATRLLSACVSSPVHVRVHVYELKGGGEGERGSELGKWFRQAGDASLSATAPTQVSSFTQRERERRRQTVDQHCHQSNAKLAADASFRVESQERLLFFYFGVKKGEQKLFVFSRSYPPLLPPKRFFLQG